MGHLILERGHFPFTDSYIVIVCYINIGKLCAECLETVLPLNFLY